MNTASAHPQTIFDSACASLREAAILESVLSLLEWDERTLLPTAAGEYRAEQMAFLAGVIHRRRTDPELGDKLAALAASPLAADPHGDVGATIRQARRDFQKRLKMPQRLVEALARATVLGQQAWVIARQNDDFPAFAPHLKSILALKLEQAQAIGYEEHPYDALLDDYEPGEKTSQVRKVLAGLRVELADLVARIVNSGVSAPRELLARNFPQAAQEAFGKRVAASIGFDFTRGRLDVTHHPFCAGMGPHDCRITTRYDEAYFPTAFFGILHEAGHGIYDQGLRCEQYGLPPGTYVSLGIHESQSRLWENLVGRCRSFWQFWMGEARKAFPQALADVSTDDFYFAVNDVRPSLIRVEADEATYNLHIVVRFELEQALLTEELPVDELPLAWREKYSAVLGATPANDADGALQDIHWSAGLFGYFPTYSLGNLYASQFFEQAGADLGSLDEMFARGEFQPLREWLREKIHSQGQCYSPAELVERVTGQPLSHAPLMRHLHGKLAPLYFK